MAMRASGIKQILAIFMCRHTNKQLGRAADGIIQGMAEQMTASIVHRFFLYTCADMLCSKAGRATQADYFSECLVTGMTRGGTYAQGDNSRPALLAWMVSEVCYRSRNMIRMALHIALCVCGVHFPLLCIG